jgi:hypothetical protein
MAAIADDLFSTRKIISTILVSLFIAAMSTYHRGLLLEIEAFPDVAERRKKIKFANKVACFIGLSSVAASLLLLL